MAVAFNNFSTKERDDYTALSARVGFVVAYYSTHSQNEAAKEFHCSSRVVSLLLKDNSVPIRVRGQPMIGSTAKDGRTPVERIGTLRPLVKSGRVKNYEEAARYLGNVKTQAVAEMFKKALQSGLLPEMNGRKTTGRFGGIKAWYRALNPCLPPTYAGLYKDEFLQRLAGPGDCLDLRKNIGMSPNQFGQALAALSKDFGLPRFSRYSSLTWYRYGLALIAKESGLVEEIHPDAFPDFKQPGYGAYMDALRAAAAGKRPRGDTPSRQVNRTIASASLCTIFGLSPRLGRRIGRGDGRWIRPLERFVREQLLQTKLSRRTCLEQLHRRAISLPVLEKEKKLMAELQCYAKAFAWQKGKRLNNTALA